MVAGKETVCNSFSMLFEIRLSLVVGSRLQNSFIERKIWMRFASSGSLASERFSLFARLPREFQEEENGKKKKVDCFAVSIAYGIGTNQNHIIALDLQCHLSVTKQGNLSNVFVLNRASVCVTLLPPYPSFQRVAPSPPPLGGATPPLIVPYGLQACSLSFRSRVDTTIACTSDQPLLTTLYQRLITRASRYIPPPLRLDYLVNCGDPRRPRTESITRPLMTAYPH